MKSPGKSIITARSVISAFIGIFSSLTERSMEQSVEPLIVVKTAPVSYFVSKLFPDVSLNFFCVPTVYDS